MHLNDKRLFLFGDSVYRAIENCEGLAIELNPDEMAAYFVNNLFDEMSDAKMLEKILDRQYYEKNKAALAKKFGKPADKITTSDIIREKNKWMNQYMEKGEMPTFMDAYLYNMARRQGKWLGGIEDMADQAGLLTDLIDQADINYLLASDSSLKKTAKRGSETAKTGAGSAYEQIEEMIRLYTAQDLDGLEAISTEHTSAAWKDQLLIHRNIKMSRRIDSLASLRTTFVAIGAAHLPGDSGVIRLLRDRGFTVEPVFSGKKIAAEDYKFKEVHIAWTRVTDNDGNYTVEMPANPASVKLFGLIDMKFLLDLFNMSGFCTAAIVSSGHTTNKDTLFNATARRMFKGDNVAPTRTLEKNGVPGREYIRASKDGNIRVQIFVGDRMVYMALISSLKKDVLASADADKFFQSFTIDRSKETSATTISTFTDSIMGISFSTPAKLSYNEKLSIKKDESWNTNCFTGVDPASGNYVMLFSKEVKPGYHILHENILHQDFIERTKKQYGNLSIDSSTLDNVKVIRMSGRYLADTAIFLNGVSIVKNGRHILLMQLGDSTSLSSQRILTSLRLIPHPAAGWKKYESPDHSFSTYGPAPVRPHEYKKGNQLQWVCYDSTTSVSFQVMPDTLNKYTWYSSDSVFWKHWMGSDTAAARLLSLKTVDNGGVKGREFIVHNKNSEIFYSRTRLLQNGDKCYKLYVSGEKELVQSAAADRFFNEFRINAPIDQEFLATSKASLLLQDLASPDSLTRHEAYSALSSAKFGKEDAKSLEDAVFRSYWFGRDSSEHINNAIARKLAVLEDPGVVDFVRTTYPTLTGDKERMQNVAIYLLAKQQTASSYALLSELLKKGPFRKQLDFSDLYAMKDSLSLTMTLIPSLKSWISDTLHTCDIAYLVLPLVDSGLLSGKTLEPYEQPFIDAAAILLPPLTRSKDYSDPNIYALIDLIGHFHSPASFAMLKRYLDVKRKYLLQQVVEALLEGEQDVPSTVLNKLAADPDTRISFYDKLDKLKKTALFPKQYLTQAWFAEASIYDAAGAEDVQVDKLTFLVKKTATFDGKSYDWYLYKVKVTEEGDSAREYLGIAGGYDAGKGGIKPANDLSAIYWKEELPDATKANTYFKAFLKAKTDNEDID